MTRIMISPSRYVQGEGELENIGKYVKSLGSKALLVASSVDQERVQASLNLSIEKYDFDMFSTNFREECTRIEIDRVLDLAEQNNCDVLIGLGGGKALDTAKAASSDSGLPVIIAPTIASTDAPTSKLAIVYTEDGEFESYYHLKKNPDLVLVDTAVIAKAPTRFIVSGMGDALATYFEARSCISANKDNMPGGKSTKAAFAIAKVCYETLLADSMKAIAAW